ncbi:unnamed protein product, partial [Gulo gulo]
PNSHPTSALIRHLVYLSLSAPSHSACVDHGRPHNRLKLLLSLLQSTSE